MNYEEMKAIVNAIEYKPNWTVELKRDVKGGDRPYIQIAAKTQDSRYRDDPTPVAWRGAKHYMSYHMCVNEVVHEVFELFQRAEVHELKEWFLFEGQPIHSPHQDPRELAIFMRNNPRAINVRENPMSMAESPSTTMPTVAMVKAIANHKRLIRES